MDDVLSAWLSTPIGSYANAYVPALKVFPVHGVHEDLTCTCGHLDCKNIGKHPFTRHGLNDANGNITEVAALFQYRSDLNLAIRTGEISGFFVLDVDFRKGGGESLEKLMTTYDEFPPTIIVATGNGCHIYFSYPKDMRITNRTDFMPGLDIRGEGGYVVGVPSKHASGRKYDFSPTSTQKTEEAPVWFLSLIQSKKKEERKPLSSDHSTGAISEWSREEVNKMLDVLDPDMSYQQWIEVGFALQSGGFPLSMWDTWSRKGEKYENGDCESRWHGFNPNHGITMGTLVSLAQLQGWKPTPTEREVVDTSVVDTLVKKAEILIKKTETIPSKKSLPLLGFDPLKLPGLIGDTVRWITKYAIRKQPELALINTLTFAGAVFGRRYASTFNTRTNIYTVGIASTGAGKEHSRKCIKDMAHASGLDERIGADAIRSDSGMLRGLMNNSSQIMMLDEFGHFLQAIGNEKSPHYIRSQTSILLKLYSASNSVYNHGDYADTKSTPIIIQFPHLCIYGTSTEETYAKSLKKSAIESGELNRFITIRARADKEYPDRTMPLYEIDEDLKKRWSKFSPKFGDSLGEIINNSEIAPDPIIVKWGKCDDIQYAIQCRQVDKINGDSPTRHLWGRLFENTLKIAMVFAIARNKKEPEFEPSDFDTAQLIVESSIEYLIHLASHHMSETIIEENNNEIVSAIIAAGGKMGKWEIARKFRKIKGRERDDLLNSLIEQEIVEVEKNVDGRGRPKTYYKIIKES